MEYPEKGAAGMAVKPAGFAPYFGNLLAGNEILETDALLGILPYPVPEHIIGPDQLLLLIHHGNAYGKILHRIHRPRRHAGGQIVQIPGKLPLLIEIAALDIDNTACHDDEKKKPQLPVLGREHNHRHKQQRYHYAGCLLVHPNIAQHFL